MPARGEKRKALDALAGEWLRDGGYDTNPRHKKIFFLISCHKSLKRIGGADLRLRAHARPHCVTGRRSNRLNYGPAWMNPDWWAVTDLNRGPSGCKPDALTAELTAPISYCLYRHSLRDSFSLVKFGFALRKKVRWFNRRKRPGPSRGRETRSSKLRGRKMLRAAAAPGCLSPETRGSYETLDRHCSNGDSPLCLLWVCVHQGRAAMGQPNRTSANFCLTLSWVDVLL